jgi:hypothetical protein
MGLSFTTLVYKIFRRVRRILRSLFLNYIPYNQKYKPRGIKRLLPTSSGVIEFLELNPPYTSTLNLDPRFVSDCSPYIKPILSVDYPADYIAAIRDGRIYSYDTCNWAIITSDNYVVEQASFQWRDDAMLEGKDNMVFKVKGFNKPKKYRGAVFSLLTGGSAKHYYFHWLFDVLPKLFFLKKIGQFEQINYFLVPNYEYRYHREYLDHFGIHEDRIISDEAEHHIEAELLFFCSGVRIEDHHPKWACDFLYNSLVNCDDRKKGNKLIYITRRDSYKNRKVGNEADLITLLESYGFESHALSEIPVLEQVMLFNSASVVVGIHGGGLSNLVFCEPGTKVLEIFADQYVRHLFYDISNKRGLLYDYILCNSERPAQDLNEGQAVGLVADLDAVEIKIRALLAPSRRVVIMRDF